ncbi:MAG: Gfo/Idh/MocA family oxidoreductase [Planctomycetota bacterium]
MPYRPPAAPIRFGIVATGTISRTMAHALHDAPSTVPTAVASRSIASAEAFAKDLGVPSAYGSYQALLDADTCDAVYIATPHNFHAEWAIRAAEAGKHVFLEKPAGLNEAEVRAIIDAAVVNGVYFAEAFKARRHPLTHRVVELLANGAVGNAHIIRCQCGGAATFDPASRLFDPHLAGGAILDIGCYAISMARLLAAACMSGHAEHFAHPTSLVAHGKLGPTGVDHAASAILAFGDGPIAELSTGLQTHDNRGLAVLGDTGKLVVEHPWVTDRRRGGRFTIELHHAGQGVEQITVEEPLSAFALEAEAAAQDILAGRAQASSPGYTHADSLSQARTLDLWRLAIGLRYPGEPA